MTAVPRVVTFGELLLRLSPPGEERLFASPELRTFFGGAEANVAVALSHLGLRCDYVTRLPDNPLGEAALDALRREAVGTDWIVRSREGGGARLGLYFVESGADLRAMRVVYDRTGSALAQIDPREIDWARVLAGASWFHATGITPALGDGPAAALAAAVGRAHAQHVPVSLDLNYREALWHGRDPRPLVEPVARQADVLIGNREAVHALLGIEATGDTLAPRVAERCGSRIVAITQREMLGAREHAWSAVLYDAASRTLARSRRHVVHVVDRVGGGDSFAAGLIAALLGKQPPPAALEFAVAAGALKLAVPGDFGRASPEDVQRLVRECT